MDGLHFNEGGDGGSEGGGEVSHEAVERFREQSRRAAAQAKQDKKQEGKRKQQDDTLVNIILQFLKDPRYSGFFLLISRILAKNVPSDFILSILALIHRDSATVLEAKNIPLKKAPTQESVFPSKLSGPLSHWTTLIFSVASSEPHRVLETLLDHDWKLDKNVTQFFSLIIQEFFVFKKFDTSFENIRSFSEQFLQNLITSLENQVQDQQKLSSNKNK